MLQIQRAGLDAAEVVPISLRMLEVIDEVSRGQGHDLNLVDIAFAPFASRVAIILPNYGSYRVPLSGGGWRRYAVWLKAIQHTGLLSATEENSETYVDRLVDFYLPIVRATVRPMLQWQPKQAPLPICFRHNRSGGGNSF